MKKCYEEKSFKADTLALIAVAKSVAIAGLVINLKKGESRMDSAIPKKFEMKKVEGSSQVDAIGYDPETKCLCVEFKSGTYVYHNVQAEDFEALNESKSVGKFLNSVIKRKCKFTKMPTNPRAE